MTTHSIQPANPANLQVWSRRSDGITLVAIYHCLVGALFLLGTLIMSIPTFILGIISLAEEPDALVGFVAVGIIAGLLLVLGLLNLAVGFGLLRMQVWARSSAIVLAIVGLLFVPIGTIFGAIILWYLLQPDVAARFE